MTTSTRRARRGVAIVGLSGLALAGAASTAAAVDEYPPIAPSSAEATCIGDIPYVSYQANFPAEFAGETVTITIPSPDGDDIVVEKTLGPDGSVSGNDILWPGASENPPDWPGWILLEDGTWVEGDDGFLWAREGITGIFEVNPTVTLSAAYPPASSICAGPQNSDNPPPPPENPPTETPPITTTSNGLPATGAQTATLALVGGGLLVGGTALVISSRRRGARANG